MHLSKADYIPRVPRKTRHAADRQIRGIDDDRPRKWLRKEFLTADMGITGANFAVADTGHDRAHGERRKHPPEFLAAARARGPRRHRKNHSAPGRPRRCSGRFSGRWAPGQALTSYSSLIGGPRAAGEADGPEEFHVVLLDNGRTRLLADVEQRDALQCIRCGACLNSCPDLRKHRRSRLRHDLPGAHRLGHHAASARRAGLVAPAVRQFAVRRVHFRVPGAHGPSSSPFPQPPQCRAAAARSLVPAPRLPRVALGHGGFDAIRAGRKTRPVRLAARSGAPVSQTVDEDPRIPSLPRRNRSAIGGPGRKIPARGYARPTKSNRRIANYERVSRKNFESRSRRHAHSGAMPVAPTGAPVFAPVTNPEQRFRDEFFALERRVH